MWSMKLVLRLLLLLTPILAQAGDEIVFGHVFRGDREIEIYTTRTICAVSGNVSGALDAAIYHQGFRNQYKMGCVLPLVGDRFKLIVTDSGEEIVFRRHEILRYSPSRRSL